MELPIVIRSPVTAADRWRSLAVIAAGGSVTCGAWLALPFVRAHPIDFVPAIPSGWIITGYIVILNLIWLVPFLGLIWLLFDVDRTWIIDEHTLTTRSLFLIGERTRSWPLNTIAGARISKESGEGGISYNVKIGLGQDRWISIRTFTREDQAMAFRDVINVALEGAHALQARLGVFPENTLQG